MSKIASGACAVLLMAATASTQQAPVPQKMTLAAQLLRGNQGMQRNLLEAAEKMPDADYAFRPTPVMRPFGQLVAHVALSQFSSCAALKGESSPHKDDKEDTPRSKADQIALLKSSAAYCDDAFGGMTDASLTEMVKVHENEFARGAFLAGSNSHANEMYGTMAVYLRLKGLVPPTTERQMAAEKAKADKDKP
jgi:uncharacterized damage-inducible protein DinB